MNVHALGGSAMLKAAVQAISAGVAMGADRPRLLAVTVLTSMDDKTLHEVGIARAHRRARHAIWLCSLKTPAWMALSPPSRKPALFAKHAAENF